MKEIWCLFSTTSEGSSVYDTLTSWWEDKPTADMLADVSMLTVEQADRLLKNYWLTYNGKYVEYRLAKCAEGKTL